MQALLIKASVTAGCIFLTLGILGPLSQEAHAQGLTLRVGDFAEYSLGDPPDDCLSTTPLYSPLFGVEDRAFAAACPGTLRWEVLRATDDGVEVRLGMSGWPSDYVLFESKEYYRNETMYERVRATLNAEHVLWIDRNTLDMTTSNGTYVGRWDFHVTNEEVASERMELARHWYNGSSISADVSVVREFHQGMSEVLNQEYGVETFVLAQTGWIEPIPEGIERYLYDLGGGWLRLRASAPVYDASSSLLLVTLSPFYSDLLFNLYGVFWLDQLTRPWPDARYLTSLILVDTNVIALPGSPDGGGLPGEPDTGGDTGGDTGTDSAGAGPPWVTLVLFAAMAAAVVLLAYRKLRPRHRGAAERPERKPGSGRQAPPFGRGKG